MSYSLTVTMHCDTEGCNVNHVGGARSRLREYLRTHQGWGCVLGHDGKKKDYCGKHWRSILEEQERNGYTLHNGDWIETAKLKEFGWRGLLDDEDAAS